MIYLVTNSQVLFENPLYKIITVEESIEKLNTIDIIGIDTETTGLDVFVNELLLAQFGCKDFQVVVDCKTVDIKKYKTFLENKEKLFLFWNAKFDLKWFLKEGIVIKNIYDGYLAERLLWMGYPNGQHSLSLKTASEIYCNVELDKTVRGKIIWSKKLTDDIVLYSANDVKYLEEIYNKQLEELKKKGLQKAIKYENAFCPVLAYTEFCGVKLDVLKWKQKMESDLKKYQDTVTALNNWVSKNLSDSEFVEINYQGDLFEGFDLTPKCIINWSSPKQVIPFFEKLGFKLETFDKKTKEKKKSVEADIIEKQKSLSDIAPLYLKYKESEKLVGTYGQNVLDQINPVTNRIHTNYNQLGTDTARLSSGGKDKDSDIKYINFQNFPRDSFTRSCFISETGNKWISCDYSGQESRIIADIANDKAMLDIFNKGNGDIHSLVAKMTFPEIVGDATLDEIKSNFKECRQNAKSVEFAINYGGDASTIQKNSGITAEEAQQVYDNYMKAFSGVKSYQDTQRKTVLKQGFIWLNKKTGHKCFIYNIDQLNEIKAKFNNEYWETYREFKKNNPNSEIVDEVRTFFREKSNIEKHAINYLCQGTGAVQFKLASIFFYKFLLDNNLLFKVKLLIPAHDEWNVEAPENISKKVADELVSCMKKAGEYFCDKLEFPAVADIGDHWIH